MDSRVLEKVRKEANLSSDVIPIEIRNKYPRNLSSRMLIERQFSLRETQQMFSKYITSAVAEDIGRV
jgi:hypothetical protein